MSNKARHMNTQTHTKKDSPKAPPQANTKPADKPEEKKAAPATAAPTPPAPKPMVLKVLKKDANYRGARQAWYSRLLEFDGKTEGEYIASTKETPPALTRNGTAENPSGWVSWFKRNGIISLQPAA